jgi:hypothetical protein
MQKYFKDGRNKWLLFGLMHWLNRELNIKEMAGTGLIKFYGKYNSKNSNKIVSGMSSMEFYG